MRTKNEHKSEKKKLKIKKTVSQKDMNQFGCPNIKLSETPVAIDSGYPIHAQPATVRRAKRQLR